MTIIQPGGSRYTSGVTTFVRDFNKIVVPSLPKEGALSLSLPHIPNEHKNGVTNALVVHAEFFFPDVDNENYRFLTHHGWWFDSWKKKFDIRLITQSIDLSSVPKPHPNKKGIVYFGNSYHDKTVIMNHLKKENDIEYVGDMKQPQKEVLDYVNKFEVGIGVGRCALEMLAMGMKVIIAGSRYGGYINDDISLEKHLYWNCNSAHYCNTRGGFDTDLEYIRDTKSQIDLELINMENKVGEYITALT
jgi:hypothetical protein